MKQGQNSNRSMKDMANMTDMIEMRIMIDMIDMINMTDITGGQDSVKNFISSESSFFLMDAVQNLNYENFENIILLFFIFF
jgi:hypothetical protein